MESDLRSFLEDRFKDLSDKMKKMEDSIIRVFDKLDTTILKTSDNSKDIQSLQEKHLEIKSSIDDKLKGVRINHEACSNNCKTFREEIKKTMDEKDRASEERLKNWIMGLGLSFIITLAVTITLKFVGGK